MFEFSPQTRRRFDLFKANRRGWWSLWIFIGLLLVCLCGELIANDKPLLIRYDGQLYYPVLHTYMETDFGGELPFEPDYASDYVRKLIAAKNGWMLFAPIPFSYDTINYDWTRHRPARRTTSTGWAPTSRPVMCWHVCCSARGYPFCSRCC